jgi:hypothetical protein
VRNPREKSRIRIWILAATLALVIVGAMVRSVLLAFNYTCDICLTYHGRTACREAVGHDQDAAIRVAVSHACESLASTQQALDECVAKPPDSVSCRQN